MALIIGVRFKAGGKQYYFDPKKLEITAGSSVIVDTVRGIEYGECITGNTIIPDENVSQPLRAVIRIATIEDNKTLARNKEKEIRAMSVCQDKIMTHKLDMKLVEAEYSFEGNKIIFFFTAEGRVDFRSLVKDLASAIHARIELRQIGVRDEAKMLGGLGICGRVFCCNQFLDEFQPVSIKMAKTQNLSLNPVKISGTCGRLMCCLKYEQDAYEDLVKRVPKQDSFVETPDGAGVISHVNLLRQKVVVRLESDEGGIKTFHSTEVRVIRSGKGKRPEGYMAPPQQELEKLRKILEAKPPVETSLTVNPLAAALEAVFSGQAPVNHMDAVSKKPDQNRGRSGNQNTDRRPNQGRSNNDNRGNRPKPDFANKPRPEGGQGHRQDQRPRRDGDKPYQNQQRPTGQKPHNQQAMETQNPNREWQKPNPRPHRRQPHTDTGGKPETK